MLGTWMYRCVIVYCILSSAFAEIWIWVLKRMLANILLLSQGWFGARLQRSWPRFLSHRSQIFFSCCWGDLERVCRSLDLVFSASAHKYSTFVARAIWSAFCCNQDLGFIGDAHKYLLQIRSGPQWPGLDLCFSASAHKNSSLVAGAIWCAFAGFWT
jgi:hypothetical protein